MSFQEVEILVHIAAPATTANDAKYRALARGYLNFEPRSRTAITSHQHPSPTPNGSRALDSQRDLGSQLGSGTQHLAGGQQPVIDSQDFSFTSVFGNLSSPELPQLPRPKTQDDEPGTQSSWVAPPSEIPDSMPENDLALTQFNSPTRLFEYFLSTTLNSSQSEQSILKRGPSQLDASQSNPSGRQPAAEPSQRSQQTRRITRSQARSEQRKDGGSQEVNTTVYSDFEIPSQTGWSQAPAHDNPTPRQSPVPSQARPPSARTPSPKPEGSQVSQASGQGQPRRPQDQPAGSQIIIPASPSVANPTSFATAPISTTTSVIEETRILSSFPSLPSNSFGEVIPSSHPLPPPSGTTLPNPSPSPAVAKPLPPSARAGSEPASKRRRASPNRFQPAGGPLARSSSDVGPRRPSATVNRLLVRKKPVRLEILSPPPPTSLADLMPEDLITAPLAHLAVQVDIKRRFTPQAQTRELRPFERGYWLVDCTTWSEELKGTAWEFLTNHLEGGLVGWGVSCKRDQEFTWIRVYCWGCVVGHIYLVLWLASQRMVKATGTVWIAGDGEKVVVMGARPPSR